MKKVGMTGLVLTVLLSLSGCMQYDRVIKVRPDGSGIIEETSLMRKEFFHQMQAMAGNIAKQAGEQKDVQDKAQT
ncbi:MAG TPA: hypothetical protein VEI46_10370, partial [Thermodesulfovibrionales bacterium]|nr:hypothetical protein [Thermodesulfovibrionales bacterium]